MIDRVRVPSRPSLAHSVRWCASEPANSPQSAMPPYKALFETLTSRRVEVRVMPDTAFGLIHGKSGVIRCADSLVADQ